MEPSAKIGSTLRLIIAAGATPVLILSINVALDVLEPLPCGKTNTRPVIMAPESSWRRSIISPVCGHTPPQKLIGSLETKAAPSAEPATMGFPSRIFSKVSPYSSRVP